MRILVVNYEYPPVGGGGGVVTRDIVEQMASRGASVTVLTSGYKGCSRMDRSNGVRVFRVPVAFRRKLEVASMASMLSYFPSSVLNAFWAMNKDSYDIVNTHFAIPSGPTGYVLARKFRIPNVLSIHGGDLYDPSKRLSPHRIPVLSATVRGVMNAAERVVAQSNDTKKRAEAYYNLTREIDVIPLGIKIPVFQKRSRQEFGFRQDQILLCTVGRLIPRKNILDMLNILWELKQKYPVKLLIIGEGPERPRIEAAVKQYGMVENVHMYGNVSDEEKYDLMDVSDIFVSTASHEGFGIVFLEAMACGLPVICYDYGGQTDFLKNGKTGFLVGLNNSSEFRGRLEEVMCAPDLMRSMADHNREYVRNYSIQNCAGRYLALFEKVIDDHSVRSH